jgi:hypothetical protein
METEKYYERNGVEVDAARVTDIKGGAGRIILTRRCFRCGGSGHYSRGICFRCNGARTERPTTVRAYTGEKLAKLNKSVLSKRNCAAEDARQKEAARIETARIENAPWLEANAGIVAAVRETAAVDALHNDAIGVAKALDNFPYYATRTAASRYGSPRTFALELVGRLDNGYALSERQIEAFKKIIADTAAKAASVHVGTVGERTELTLTTDKKIPLESTRGGYGWHEAPRFIHLLHDVSGNRVVYFGSSEALGAEGETATVRATVVEHGEREGVRQTKIQRPTAIKGADAEAA